MYRGDDGDVDKLAATDLGAPEGSGAGAAFKSTPVNSISNGFVSVIRSETRMAIIVMMYAQHRCSRPTIVREVFLVNRSRLENDFILMIFTSIRRKISRKNQKIMCSFQRRRIKIKL